MLMQIKQTLWKLFVVASIVAAYSGVAVLADVERSEIYEVGVVGADEQPAEKPVYRCPKLSFVLKTACHNPKNDEEKKTGEEKAAGEKKTGNGNQNTSVLLP